MYLLVAMKVLGEALLAMMPKKGKAKLRVDEAAIMLQSSIKMVCFNCNVLEATWLIER